MKKGEEGGGRCEGREVEWRRGRRNGMSVEERRVRGKARGVEGWGGEGIQAFTVESGLISPHTLLPSHPSPLTPFSPLSPLFFIFPTIYENSPSESVCTTVKSIGPLPTVKA